MGPQYIPLDFQHQEQEAIFRTPAEWAGRAPWRSASVISWDAMRYIRWHFILPVSRSRAVIHNWPAVVQCQSNHFTSPLTSRLFSPVILNFLRLICAVCIQKWIQYTCGCKENSEFIQCNARCGTSVKYERVTREKEKDSTNYCRNHLVKAWGLVHIASVILYGLCTTGCHDVDAWRSWV